jgi:DNA-binding MarR family transcriptional regulator/GNAT superfamily N-acetyltransferase
MDADLATQIDAVRRFNRFYTAALGLLDRAHLGSPYSLAETRVLYELAHRDDATASVLAAELGLDAGYLSRILGRLGRFGLVERTAVAGDARRSRLSLTGDGHAALGPLQERTRAELARRLAPLAPAGRAAMVDGMATIARQLGGAQAPITVRRHRPGDMGMLVSRQAALYHAEYGWDDSFEALVAGIASAFLTAHDPERERAFIAERDGLMMGTALVVAQDDTVAKLRLLYVEPAARGTGLGRRLVRDCVDFAAAAGYRRMVLWTNDILHAARRIYETEGFELTASEPHHSFGHDLVGETWERALVPA